MLYVISREKSSTLSFFLLDFVSSPGYPLQYRTIYVYSEGEYFTWNHYFELGVCPCIATGEMNCLHTYKYAWSQILAFRQLARVCNIHLILHLKILKSLLESTWSGCFRCCRSCDLATGDLGRIALASFLNELNNWFFFQFFYISLTLLKYFYKLVSPQMLGLLISPTHLKVLKLWGTIILRQKQS